MNPARFADALREIEALLEAGAVRTGREAVDAYGVSTLSSERRTVRAVVLPRTTEEIVGVVRIAASHRIPLYPISRGGNWGYGSRSPVAEGSIVVELSRMQGIEIADAELGVFAVEPGVTTADLKEFLARESLPFLPPVIVSGPGASVIGNALERGYSATKPTDRISTLAALEAVLPDGTLYRSSTIRHGAALPSSTYRWGVGPYLDGLFSQSGLGIVTKAWFVLDRVPESTKAVLVSVPAQELSALIDAARGAQETLGSAVPALKIMSPVRMLSRLAPYAGPREGALPEHEVRDRLKPFALREWTLIATVQGTTEIIQAAQRGLRKIFRERHMRMHLFSSRGASIMNDIKQLLPARLKHRWWFLEIVRSYLSAAEGRIPRSNAKLPFWRRGKMTDRDVGEGEYDADPTCGLIFFAAIVPMKGIVVERVVRQLEESCRKHGLEPLVTLASNSERTLHLTVPLLFKKDNEEERRGAHACYRELAAIVEKEGGFVSRATVETMDTVVRPEREFWAFAERIKDAIDPYRIISPGRYSHMQKESGRTSPQKGNPAADAVGRPTTSSDR